MFILSKRTFLKATAIITLAPLAHTASAQISTASALNRAGRFRALSQRTAKAYCQLQQEVMPENARDILASAQRLMQLGFDELNKAALANDGTRLLNALQLDATGLTAIVASAPTRDGVVSASAQADKMLLTADKLMLVIEAAAKQPSAKLMNVAGRQRMLSQRLAKNYFLLAAGSESKASHEQLVADRAEFKQAMSTLSGAPISTSAIRNELQLAQSQWVFFEAALNRKPDMDSLRNIATASERLLEVNNNLTVFYEAALKDLLGTT